MHRPSLLVVAGLMVLVATTTALAQTIYVNPCKEFATPLDGSPEHPYPTLARGLGAAPKGSTLMLLGSTPASEVTVAYPETGVFGDGSKRNPVETLYGTVQIGGLAGTKRLWQLTGDKDVELGVPTPGQTVSRFGLLGTDLGNSFEHAGRLYFLFGDSWPLAPPAGRCLVPTNSDSIAWIPAYSDPEQPVRLNFLTTSDGCYLPPTVTRTYQDGSSTIISRGEFEVPLAGFSGVNQEMYVFFSTDHFKRPPYEEIDDYMGRSVLARAKGDPDGAEFTYLYDVSCLPEIHCDGKDPVGRFINVAPVKVGTFDIPELPAAVPQEEGLLVWGTGAYHETDVYLAYVPLNSVENQDAWKYAVTDGQGKLIGWGSYEVNATPLFTQPTPHCDLRQRHCKMGELSVAWNPFLRKWLMLYNHGEPAGINYRVADKPWGPWHGPYVLYDAACDRGFCNFVHEANSNPPCDHIAYQPWRASEAINGTLYGPYLIPRFTKGDATTTTIYWTMSTFNPYEVMLMRSILRLSDARRIDHPVH